MPYKKTAYLFDLDGVVVDSVREDLKLDFAVRDFSRFEAEIPSFDSFEWAVEFIRAVAGKHHILFLTARNEAYRADTEVWLEAHLKLKRGQYSMVMRKTEDTRRDTEVKAENLIQAMKKYEILAAFDDNIDNARLYSYFGIKSCCVI